MSCRELLASQEECQVFENHGRGTSLTAPATAARRNSDVVRPTDWRCTAGENFRAKVRLKPNPRLGISLGVGAAAVKGPVAPGIFDRFGHRRAMSGKDFTAGIPEPANRPAIVPGLRPCR